MFHIYYNTFQESGAKRSGAKLGSTAKKAKIETEKERTPLQQDDNYKPLMDWITDGGLVYAAAKYEQRPDADKFYRQQVAEAQKQKIIVVGGGIAGLTAAHELSLIGHDVTILEIQSRVGGRIKTFREGFQDGLHAEGGAMRLSDNHYLTHAYLKKFDIKLEKFQNYQENAYMLIQGEKIRMKDFMNNNYHYSQKYWPGWNDNLSTKLKAEVKHILDYHFRTIQPVIDELGTNPSPQKWQDWVSKWSKISLEDFLRSDKDQSASDDKLRPWPEVAIAGFKVSTYTPMMYGDMASYLREILGNWWADDLTTPVDGMDQLPKAFLRPGAGWNSELDLSKKIVYGVKVTKIEKGMTDAGTRSKSKSSAVTVYGTNVFTGQEMSFTGDSVFITVTLPILRQMDVPLQEKQKAAIRDITYACSTKVLLQCKTRFWQKDVGRGGFSKTDMMFGQLHYPKYDGSPIPDDERGILVVYTWDKDAVAFGAQTKEEAIKSAVNQISKIHPEIIKEFEVGNVQAWCSDPTAQGAFTHLHPYEYLDSLQCLMKPVPPIYIAGEAISWSNGWIQGAIFSSLKQCLMFHLGKDIDPMKLKLPTRQK